MDENTTDRLFERLIRQRRYVGGTCLAEHVMAAYAAGSLDESERVKADEHMQECSECRRSAEDLSRALAWFRAHGAEAYAGFVDRAAAAGVAPWNGCPAPSLLRRYREGSLPESPQGALLAARLRAHVGRCRDCSDRLGRFEAAMEAPTARLRDFVAGLVPQFDRPLALLMEALSLASVARGRPALALATAGYRSAAPQVITAPVLCEDGKVILDAEGTPLECRFEVVEARIEPDGFLRIDLYTGQSQYARRQGSAYRARASLCSEHLCLVLADSIIDEAGKATFAGMVPQVVAVESLPVSYLDVTVCKDPARAGEGTSS